MKGSVIIMIKKNDIILIGGILLISLAVILIINFTKTEGSNLIVTIDGEKYDTFELNKDTIFTVNGLNGEWNTFEIKDGNVNMLDASCPDKLCVKDFKDIHYNHESIVCLPNKVVLEIKGGEESKVDMIAN